MIIGQCKSISLPFSNLFADICEGDLLIKTSKIHQIIATLQGPNWTLRLHCCNQINSVIQQINQVKNCLWI